MENRRPFLYDAHVALGAKMVPFGGWEMPLAYQSGTVAEHLACRSDAVVFDVSHLGTVRCDGPGMFDALQDTLTNDLRKIAPGRAQYTHLLTAALPGHDVTSERCVLAVQGPHARAKVAALGEDFADVARFSVRRFDFHGAQVRVAGTGYTGEDGLEIAAPNEVAEEILALLVAADITPAGLGARDTLRLEAALPLYGHELSLTSTTLEARLGWVLGWEKDTFKGRDAVLAERARGVNRHLTGVVSEGRQPLRDGGEVLVGGEVVGTLTSGNFSPVLGRGIGLGLLRGELEPDTPATVQLRGREIAVTITSLPFVRKASSRG
jgi:aminomethyltransferase